MYKVLLVDDEPLVLSGIKFLIEWQKLNCVISNVARNGQQALEIIQTEHPDIVLCDINMPIMTGIELLEKMKEKAFSPSFIMLTNYQEFDMARESLRLKAVDYLLKTQLDADILEKAVLSAIHECDKKNKIANVNMTDEALEHNRIQVIGSHLQKIWEQSYVNYNSYSFEVLDKFMVLQNFFVLQIILDYSTLPESEHFDERDKHRIFECIHEFMSVLLPKVYKDYVIFYPDDKHRHFFIFVWNAEKHSYLENTGLFFSKLLSNAANVTPTRISILITDFFSQEGELSQGNGCVQGQELSKGQELSVALEELSQMKEYYFHNDADYINYAETSFNPMPPIDIQKLNNKLIFEIRLKNIATCKHCLKQLEEHILGTPPHNRKDILFACAELYTSVATVFSNMSGESSSDSYFLNLSAMLQKIHSFINRRQVQSWFHDFSLHIIALLHNMTNSKSDILDKVKQYIIQNIDARIMLQDVADYVNISPSYLSALFKKQYNQNLVDYINKEKMERACQLLRDGKHRIYEISYLLSFENAYYFTKVFKRHIGMTPKEYQYKIRGKREKENA